MSEPVLLPPFIHRVICGRKLEKLRQATGLTQTEVAEKAGCSQGKVTNMEAGINRIKAHDLQALFDVYGADEASRAFCVEHAEAGGKQPRRGILRSRFTGDMRTLIDLECSAASAWVHNCMLVPGLLQTEDYMRYLFRAARPSRPPETIDQDTKNRLDRQFILDNPHQHFWFLIDEAALRRMTNMDGGPKIMRAQLERLIEAVDRPNIEIQVVPFDHGYYIGQEDDYRIFSYHTEPLVQVVYAEKHDGRALLQDSARVNRFLTTWEHQKAAALGPEQTRSFLRDIASRL